MHGDRRAVRADDDAVDGERDRDPLVLADAAVVVGLEVRQPRLLIERAGLKGYTVGGARVSAKHANFIMAERGATSGDIYAVIKEIKRVIYDKYGVSLKEEIKYVGVFD